MSRFTVVTLAPGQAEFLPDCIDSVQSQGSLVERHIVIDPSRDPTVAKICREKLRPEDTLLTVADDGPASGLNNGLAEVHTDLFAYLNADDALLPGALREASSVLEVADVVVGDALVVDRRLRPKYRHLHTRVSPFRIAVRSTQVVQQSTFYSTSAVRAAGGFNPENSVCWDTELLLDLALQGARFAYRRRTWAQFRLYDESISGSGRLMQEYECERQRLAARAGFRSGDMAVGRLVGRILRYSERPELLREGVRKRVP